VYRLCIAHDGPKTADPTLAPLRSAFVPTFREDRSNSAQLLVTILDLRLDR
jgi:hypothetical protein